MKINLYNFNINQIPQEEDDYHEFKSSLIEKELADKLCKAVSGFANAGGGLFIVGINDKTGNADGGILRSKGQKTQEGQPIKDWVDTVISKIEPIPKYEIILLDEVYDRGFLHDDRVVMVIAVEESFIGPHMFDYKYYIRAGRHTVPARHFIVEAIRAKRFLSKPSLSHIFRLKPKNDQILQLGLVAINDSPAIDIMLSLEPLPQHLKKYGSEFPIHIPIIDRNNPYYLDVALYNDCETSFGHNTILKLEYEDPFSNKYKIEKIVGVKSAPPVNIGSDEIKKALEEIVKAITQLKQ
ncbi:ATP-binding protein [Fibrella sp. HMF5335]|uniref:ATP-binding protein n=1 Tax=Fibrella rubiginis TaxID=2817060 RepID=A0A939GFI9_9BACT|nr:ATP-binding protein [Fibrella rubiginis]MBO0935781.1 ATP-binding protein [Fibrella rubiginis]